MGNPQVRSPHIDSLAASGTLFEQALAASPVCSPCRAQILSGKYGDRPGTQVRFPESPFLYKLPHETTSIAELFSAAGYETGYIGKWHVHPRDGRDTDHPGYIPPGEGRQGFQLWASGGVPTGHFDTTYYRDSPEPLLHRGFACDSETDLALDFLRTSRQRPFFLMVSWNPPHDPYTPPEAFDLYRPEEIEVPPNVPTTQRLAAARDLAGYYGLISAVDHNVGRLLDALTELGLRENTVVLLTSDHGDLLHSHKRADEPSHKRRPWSTAAQVPMILSWPGRIIAGRRSATLAGSVDVLPTLLKLARLPFPGDLQGASHARELLGGAPHGRDSFFLHMTSRAGTPFRAPWRAVRTQTAWYAESGGLDGAEWLLYEHREDPHELHNRLEDPRFAPLKQDLQERLYDWQERLGDRIDLRAYYRSHGARKA